MNMNFKISKRNVIYIVFVLGFLVYLVFANDVAYFIASSSSDLAKGMSLESYETTVEGHCGVETSEYQGGMMEDFRIYGWAYGEVDFDTSLSKKTSILLVDDNNKTFVAPAVVAIRPDIYTQEVAYHSVPSTAVGFEAIFSTLLLPNGIYRLYLYVEETEELLSLIDTEVDYIKMGAEMHDHRMDSIQINQPIQEGEAKFALDQVEYQDGYLLVKGWGFFIEPDEASADIYIAIKNGKDEERVYHLDKFNREDIAQAFGELYLNSGFRSFLYLPDSFNDDILSFKLMTNINNNFYRSSQSITFEKTKEGFSKQI